ncbi:unnamed protein product [Rhizophagus irregularis]|nr:unnamed protein product [Rhizophagus irregularis]
MTHQSITLNVNKPHKKNFLSFDIKFNKFTLEEVTISPYILVKLRFFIHEFCKFYEFFFWHTLILPVLENTPSANTIPEQ